MTRSRSIWWLLAGGFSVFVAVVVWVENHSRAAALHRLEQHARAVAPALWHIDPRLASDYLRLAAESYGYETVEVRDSTNRIFFVAHGPALHGVETVFDRLGLLPRVDLNSGIVQDGHVLGTIQARWISRNLYLETYVLLALALLVVIAERSLRVIEGKRTLEQRVIERTQQLAEREAGLRQLTRLLDLSPDVVFVREIDGPVRYWNQGAARFVGTDDCAVAATRLHAFFDTVISRDHSTTLVARGTWSGEVASAGADGKTRRFHVSASLTPDEQGEQKRVLLIASDITVRKELESYLLRAQRAQAVGTLASGVAHDFNNLLTPILLSTQLLRLDPELSSSSRSTVDTMEQCARRGADLVRQLLNLSGNRPAHRTSVHLPDVLRDVAGLLQGTFPKTIALSTDWPPRLPSIEADATNLHQAILNLCVNARDAMPDGGRLSVTAHLAKLTPLQRARRPDASATEWIAVAVSDTGPGIAPEMQDKIFEPFFTTKSPGQGTGLGLATVQGIAHSHGGFVELESAPGAGAKFTLYFPAQTAPRTGERVAARTPPPRGAGETILLVDDEPAVLGATSRLLENAGFRVRTAASGADALQLMAAHRHEIRGVLTDLMMPGMDGIALARALREQAPTLPVAVMTGLLNQTNREAIAAANFRVTLAKPYRADELLWCVQQLLAAK